MTETTAPERLQEESAPDTERPPAMPDPERTLLIASTAVAELDLLTDELLALAEALTAQGDPGCTLAASRISELVRGSVNRVCAKVGVG